MVLKNISSDSYVSSYLITSWIPSFSFGLCRRSLMTYRVFSTRSVDYTSVDLGILPAGSKWEDFSLERQEMVNSLNRNGCYFFFLRFDLSHLCDTRWFVELNKPGVIGQCLNKDGQVDIDYDGLMDKLFSGLNFVTNPEFAYLSITKVDTGHLNPKIILPKNLYVNVIFAVRSLLGNSDRAVGEHIAENLCRFNFWVNCSVDRVVFLPTPAIIHQYWDSLFDDFYINGRLDEKAWCNYHSWKFYHWNFFKEKRIGLVRTAQAVENWGEFFDNVYMMYWTWYPPVPDYLSYRIPTVCATSIYDSPTILLHLLRVYCLINSIEYFDNFFYQKKVTFYTPLGDHLWFKANIRLILETLVVRFNDQLFILDIPRILSAQLDNTVNLIKLDPLFLTKGW